MSCRLRHDICLKNIHICIYDSCLTVIKLMNFRYPDRVMTLSGDEDLGKKLLMCHTYVTVICRWTISSRLSESKTLLSEFNDLSLMTILGGNYLTNNAFPMERVVPISDGQVPRKWSINDGSRRRDSSQLVHYDLCPSPFNQVR